MHTKYRIRLTAAFLQSRVSWPLMSVKKQGPSSKVQDAIRPTKIWKFLQQQVRYKINVTNNSFNKYYVYTFLNKYLLQNRHMKSIICMNKFLLFMKEGVFYQKFLFNLFCSLQLVFRKVFFLVVKKKFKLV